jgi:hypothetical protein
MPRYIFIALLVVGACCGMVWAVHPFLSPPQGLYDGNYQHLIQDRYPFHLIDPAWLSNDMFWSFAETGARVGALTIGIICIIVFIRFRRHEKPAALDR